MTTFKKLQNSTNVQTGCKGHLEEGNNELFGAVKGGGSSNHRRLPRNRDFWAGFCRLNKS